MSARQDAAAFMDDPLGWAPPARLAPLLAPGLGADTVDRLRRSPRLRRRASAALAAHLGDGSVEALPSEDSALALASPEELARAVSIAGAIWHAPRVRNLVLARDIAAFVERHGEAAREAALRHRETAPRRRQAHPAQGDLEADVARDGAACLAAWIDALPRWAALRVRLKWTPPAGPALDEALRARAVATAREAARLACAP